MISLFRTIVASTSLLVAVHASATPIGGIEFPQGAISFADLVVSYMPGSDVGGTYMGPAEALGTPDYNDSMEEGAVSLGEGGSLTVAFTDNSLTTSGDSEKDLWIFEIGSAVESFQVEISTNNINWIDLGFVLGQPTGIDIDAIIGVDVGELYSYVRLTDTPGNQSGFPYGEADIDAVGAISSGQAVPLPAPAGFALFGLGLILLAVSRRRGEA